MIFRAAWAPTARLGLASPWDGGSNLSHPSPGTKHLLLLKGSHLSKVIDGFFLLVAEGTMFYTDRHHDQHYHYRIDLKLPPFTPFLIC